MHRRLQIIYIYVRKCTEDYKLYIYVRKCTEGYKLYIYKKMYRRLQIHRNTWYISFPQTEKELETCIQTTQLAGAVQYTDCFSTEG